MKKITVLGVGLVGKAIAIDVCNDYKVQAVDIDETKLKDLETFNQIARKAVDLSDSRQLRKTIWGSDLVINALPGYMGNVTLKSIIEEKLNVVDIAFSPEDPFELDELAKTMGVTAVVDCGVAPGLSNIIMGHYHRQMERVDSFECLVGGLPREREWPCEYKAVFSPMDVIEEYTRPARYIENGKEVIRPALSDPELIHIQGIATLESFNTDGLRTLARTMKVPNMKEKTLRYPGHIHLMKALREIGFFSKTPVAIKGALVSPLEFTSHILFPKWKMRPDEYDFTFMRVTITGIENNSRKRVLIELYDEFQPETGTTSMARTTGYTCTAVARLVLEGIFARKGVCPPEYIGEVPGLIEKIIDYLEKRNIRLKFN